MSKFPEDVPVPRVSELEFGFIEPGHGLKGKKEWISGDDDMFEMVEMHKEKKEIMLWCYSTSESSSKSFCSSSQNSSRYDDHVKKVLEVDKLYTELQEKHKGKYSPEQLRTRAHLIQIANTAARIARQTSPSSNKPKRSDSPPPTPTSKIVTPVDSFSPGKRVSLRTECIE